MNKWLVAVTVAALLPASPRAEPAGDPVRPLVILAQPQAAAPQEYQADDYRKACVDLFIRGTLPQP